MRHDGTVYRITDILDFESVMTVAVESKRKKLLRITELDPMPPVEAMGRMQLLPLDAITEAERKTVERRLEIIQPLLNMTRPGRAAFEKRAREVGCHYTTLYRWYRRYEASEDGRTLIPQRRGWKKGRVRIPSRAEEIIQKVLDEFYLTEDRHSIEETISEVRQQCLEDNDKIYPPSDSTIRERIYRIPEWERLSRRGFKERARHKFRPVPGHFPGADYPLAVVQIDHTPVDLILVDDENRESIGRAWLTLAMDVSTRMVTGYYLSLDPPSTTSVAMCLSHSFFPKERWLSDIGVSAEWPVWGFPKKIHADNALEFHSNALMQACVKYNINLEFRPVKRPEYGGHIERLLGTLNNDIHNLPGTTFSSIEKKGEYDSEKRAVLTMDEFERVLVELICNVYHKKVHSALEKAPLKQWDIEIHGDAKTDGIGLPDLPADPSTLEKDFLPMFERTVQRTGVSIDGLSYYAPVLNQWIGARDPKDRKRKRKFTFRRDPRNITTIWIWEPDTSRYFAVPDARQSLPPMSIWEFREAKELARKEGHDPKSSAEIDRAYKRIREIAENAKAKTRKTRRKTQRRKGHEKIQSPAPANAPTDVAERTPSEDLTDDELLEGFPVTTLGWVPQFNQSEDVQGTHENM